MDDKTPTPDQTPDHTPHHTSGSVPDAQTVPVTPTPGEAPHPAAPAAAPAPAPTESKPGRKRALLIGGGIAAAVVLAGGGIAIGAAIGDEFGDDDSSSMSDDAGHENTQGDDASRDDSDRDDSADDEGASTNGSGSGTDIGTASADELIEIADAARGAAEGDVTSIDAKRDGTWEVQLTNAAGDETEVRVDADLAASVISTDPADGDDTRASLSLDDETIRALVTAALDEADGMITDLDVDGDEASPYDASVLTSDNRSIDIDINADFAVVGTDVDD